MLKILEGYKPKGELKGIPLEIIEKMLFYQEKQNSKQDLKVFEENITTGKKKGGFTWEDTPEGFSFWKWVLVDREFYEFFLKYPRPADSNKLRFVEGYKPSPISPLKALPLEILDKMIEYQIEQGNEASIKVFEDDIEACKATGGFDWETTKEGSKFWSLIIRVFEHDTFFYKYPYKVFPVKALSNDKLVILLNYNQETKSGLGFTKKDKTIKLYNNIEPVEIKDSIRNFNDLLGCKVTNRVNGREVFIKEISLEGKNNDIIFNRNSRNILDIITLRELMNCYRQY